MKFEGQAIRCSILEPALDSLIVELQFNLQEDSVNKLNAVALKELSQVVHQIRTNPKIQGLLITSGKDCFIVGADVTEFLSHFKKSNEELSEWLKQTNDLFSQIEDFPFPVVSAINGFALGGGFELALATHYRVMSVDTKVGLPETKLGIFPGWGGTVRLSRLIGAENAIEWIAGGEQWDAEATLKVGAVDALVSTDRVRQVALELLKKAITGQLDWKARREEKVRPLNLNAIESTMVFESAKAFVSKQAGPHYPAPLLAIEVMQKGSFKNRNEALAIETVGFVQVAKTPVAHALVSIFLNDQWIKKNSKKISKEAKSISMSAVVGSGIMGGGIAYQSASKGIPILMKDISSAAIEIGLKEANKLLQKQVSRNKITSVQMGQVLSSIRSTLSYGDFQATDIVIEAVVEKEEVKKSVLAEVEKSVKPGTILSSNTSTISISRLAEELKHPENFCGVHFFNPVHRMPLVEIIRGKKTNDQTIATAVAYVTKIGKTPIVVNDCAGFFVNRVLFPYFAGFMKLLQEGVAYSRVDQVMEKFGWPMGPAYLLDVVGMDTAYHANQVMAREYPDRMKHSEKTAIDLLYEKGRFGQKSSEGFYAYFLDKKGFPKKEIDPRTDELLKTGVASKFQYPNSSVTDLEIVERLMLPMLFESSRCLEEKIVSHPAEVELGLVYGLGFPPFRGGVLRYAESIGISEIVKLAKKYSKLGKLYEPTHQILQLAQSGESF